MSNIATSLKSAGGNITITALSAVSEPAGTIKVCNLQWNPRIPAATEVIIPISEYWLLTDLFIAKSTDDGSAEPVIEFKKDNDRLLDTSQQLNVVLVTSAQRPNGLHAGLGYEGGSHMTANSISGVAIGAAEANLSIKAVAPFEKTG